MAESPGDDELDSIYERYVEEWLPDADEDYLEAIGFGESKSGTSDDTAWNNLVQEKLPKPSSQAREGGRFVKGKMEVGTWNAWRRKAADWFGSRAEGKAKGLVEEKEIALVRKSVERRGREKADAVSKRLQGIRLLSRGAEVERSSLLSGLFREAGKITTSFTSQLRSAGSVERVAEILGQARQELTGRNLAAIEEQSRIAAEGFA